MQASNNKKKKYHDGVHKKSQRLSITFEQALAGHNNRSGEVQASEEGGKRDEEEASFKIFSPEQLMRQKGARTLRLMTARWQL